MVPLNVNNINLYQTMFYGFSSAGRPAERRRFRKAVPAALKPNWKVNCRGRFPRNRPLYYRNRNRIKSNDFGVHEGRP